MFLELHFLFLLAPDQLHLQSKRHEKRVEVLENRHRGWQARQDKRERGGEQW